MAYNYIAGAAADEYTMRRNREAFNWVELMPKRVASANAPNTKAPTGLVRNPTPKAPTDSSNEAVGSSAGNMTFAITEARKP